MVRVGEPPTGAAPLPGHVSPFRRAAGEISTTATTVRPVFEPSGETP